MTKPRVLCAKSVVFGEKVFSHLGEVTLVADNKITHDIVRDHDYLIIRSKTPVTPNLINNTGIKLIGTATSGTDHIAKDCPVPFICAKGSNASSVAEYVMSALLHLHGDVSYAGKTLGIIGYGCVGQCLARYARALGMNVLANDPPLEKMAQGSDLSDLNAIFREADFVSLHIPLVKEGLYKTLSYADRDFFRQFKKPLVFINTARGDVIDEDALLWAINEGIVSHSVVDVWNNEPQINRELLERATLATPHIAGYSWPGRIKGTLQVYEQLCAFLEVTPVWQLKDFYDLYGTQLYDIEKDSQGLKAAADFSSTKIAATFTRLRQTYPKRDELSPVAIAG